MTATDTDVFFEGCDVDILNGCGENSILNGLENLLVGYEDQQYWNLLGTPCSIDDDCTVTEGSCRPSRAGSMRPVYWNGLTTSDIRDCASFRPWMPSALLKEL